MWYTNLDPKLIRKGGRKAPIMDLDDCMELLEASMPDPEPGSLCYGFDNLYGMVYAERGLFAKAAKDLKKVDVEYSNFEVEDFHVADNGVPYLLIFFGGDDQIPVYAALYFDGKDWRCYIPTYGNTYDRKAKQAYGYDLAGWSGKKTFTYWESEDPNDTPHTRVFTDLDDWEEFQGDLAENLDVSMDALQEDFSSRVEPTGELDHAACEILKKKLVKRVLSWDEAQNREY